MYELLDHWREREKDGLDAIIWNPKCDALNTNESCPERTRTRSRNRRTSVSAPTVPQIDMQASPERAAFLDEDSEEENFEVEFQRILDNEFDEESDSDPRHQAPVPYPCTPCIPSNSSHKLMITIADRLHLESFERLLSPAPSKDINMPGEQLLSLQIYRIFTGIRNQTAEPPQGSSPSRAFLDRLSAQTANPVLSDEDMGVPGQQLFASPVASGTHVIRMEIIGAPVQAQGNSPKGNSPSRSFIERISVQTPNSKWFLHLQIYWLFMGIIGEPSVRDRERSSSRSPLETVSAQTPNLIPPDIPVQPVRRSNRDRKLTKKG